jgi:hypothetical protein
VLDICSFCSSRPSEDDFPVPKHAAVWYSSRILFCDLYFIGLFSFGW